MPMASTGRQQGSMENIIHNYIFIKRKKDELLQKQLVHRNSTSVPQYITQ
jgi:hypothetical protein